MKFRSSKQKQQAPASVMRESAFTETQLTSLTKAAQEVVETTEAFYRCEISHANTTVDVLLYSKISPLQPFVFSGTARQGLQTVGVRTVCCQRFTFLKDFARETFHLCAGCRKVVKFPYYNLSFYSGLSMDYEENFPLLQKFLTFFLQESAVAPLYHPLLLAQLEELADLFRILHRDFVLETMLQDLMRKKTNG